MKLITKFVANDGTEFYKRDECLDYDDLEAKVQEALKILKPVPKDDGCKFSNGAGYVQHTKDEVMEFRRVMLNLIKTKIQHKWVDQSLENPEADPSWVARLVSDCGIQCLNQAWGRMQNIDKKFREWGQPYYASHPEEAQMFEVSVNL